MVQKWVRPKNGVVENHGVPEDQLEIQFRDYAPPGVEFQGVKLLKTAPQKCRRMALSPMAFLVAVEERQCQNAKKLRKLHHLDEWNKTECALEFLT